jgi:cobalt-zinc-cadmium efflux system outer membrane protein
MLRKMNLSRWGNKRKARWRGLAIFGFLGLLAGGVTTLGAEELKLPDLIAEALKNNPELQASQAGLLVAKHKIPQAGALPDPMLMTGYQNEGYNSYTFGEMPDAYWMFSLTQTVPFYGKRGLKEEMAAREAEGIRHGFQNLRLKTVSRVKELYFDLFFAHKTRDLLQEKGDLYQAIEQAALTRYRSGMAPQQEVVMAQTEKYMLLEKEEMAAQRIQALEGMLNSVLGREVQSPLGRPQELPAAPCPWTLEELLLQAKDHSSDIQAKAQMIRGTEAKVEMAKKEYYPDFTLGAGLFKRNGIYEDMWSLTATVNIPLFYQDKQRQGVLEAQAARRQAQKELQATETMLSANLRENYSMVKSAEKLMALYREGLMPKTRQDFQLALSGYLTGRIEAITVLSRLKALLDYELLYWGQQTEREKALARLESLTGTTELPRRDEQDENK